MAFLIGIAIILWIGSGILGYGMVLSYAWNNWRFLWETKKEIRGIYGFCVYIATIGIIGYILALVFTNFGKYGLKFKVSKAELCQRQKQIDRDPLSLI